MSAAKAKVARAAVAQSKKVGPKTAPKAAPKTKAKAAPKSTAKPPVKYDLTLYVAGSTAKSVAATKNLQAFCEKHMAGQFRITIVDLLVRPQLAAGDQIVAIPTLVRKLPVPIRKIIGDLSNEERVLVGMQMKKLVDES